MSYVEKAVYRYVKHIFTSGIKVLFSKKYIFYTIAFILISVTSTIFYLIEKELTTIDIGYILIGIELSVAVTYLIFGLFFSRYPLKFWAGPAFFVAAGGSVLIYYLPKIANFDISPYIAGVCYLLWIIVSVFLTFSLSRNFWGNKVLGSVMFLGKQADKGSILFGGIVFVLSLVNAAMGGFLIYSGINPRDNFLIITAVFAVLAVVIINVIIFSLGKRDDVFFTILAFFYIFASFTLWKLTIYIIRGQEPSDNIGSIIVALFLIFYTVSNYGKKVKKIETSIVDQTEIQEEELSKRKRRRRKRKMKKEVIIEEDEKWRLLDIPRFIGPLGVLMSIMGLILGYHVTYLQIFAKTDLFANIFTTADFSVNNLIGLKDKFAVIFLPSMLVFFLLSYLWSDNFRKYASPILYRFEFLPPFEELVERIDRIKSGEDSWKDYANMFLKEGVKIGVKSTAQKLFVSPTKKVAGAIGGAYSKTKSGVGRVFRRRKKDDKSPKEDESP